MAKILVTGGLGFIGSHTVVELVNAGYEPIIIDNLSNSDIKILDQLTKIIGYKPKFHKLDLSDEPAVKKLAELEPDVSGIIHFAAYKAVGESVHKPLKYYRNNFFNAQVHHLPYQEYRFGGCLRTIINSRQNMRVHVDSHRFIIESDISLYFLFLKKPKHRHSLSTQY